MEQDKRESKGCQRAFRDELKRDSIVSLFSRKRRGLKLFDSFHASMLS